MLRNIFNVVTWLAIAVSFFLALLLVAIEVYGPKQLPTPAVTVTKIMPIPDVKAPDLTRILRLTGRWSMASGCPITPSVVATNQHVVSMLPSSDIDNIPYITSSDSDPTPNLFVPVVGLKYADIAFGVLDRDVKPYPISKAAPVAGERVWWTGYDFRKGDTFMDTRVFSGHVIRIVGGLLVIDGETVQGTSGSCILDAHGEVVGIVSWLTASEDDKRDMTVGVALYGDIYKPAIDIATLNSGR
jgi:hypothetical protein